MLWIIPVVCFCLCSPFTGELDIWPRVSKYSNSLSCQQKSPIFVWSASDLTRFCSLFGLLHIPFPLCLGTIIPRASCLSLAALLCLYKHGALGFDTLNHMVRTSKLLFRRINWNLSVQEVEGRRLWFDSGEGESDFSKWFLINAPNVLFFSFLLSPTRQILAGTPEPEYLLKAELISDTTQSTEHRHRFGWLEGENDQEGISNIKL